MRSQWRQRVAYLDERPRSGSCSFHREGPTGLPGGEAIHFTRHNVYLGRHPIPSLPWTRLLLSQQARQAGCSLSLPLLESPGTPASREGASEGSGGHDLTPFVMSPARDALCRRFPTRRRTPGKSASQSVRPLAMNPKKDPRAKVEPRPRVGVHRGAGAHWHCGVRGTVPPGVAP
jgi:hypothetical protein